MLALSFIAILLVNGGAISSHDSNKKSNRIDANYSCEKSDVESNKDIRTYAFILFAKMQKTCMTKYYGS